MRCVVNCAILSVVAICGLGFFAEPGRTSGSEQSGRAAFDVPRLWEYSAPLIAPQKRDINPSRSQKDPAVVFYGGKWHVFMTSTTTEIGEPNSWTGGRADARRREE
ncbi:MAG: hypothetical protein M1376_15290 [Planctomycetes bacterium]|nr:hypothetical protein [Planctomycetota bacterium]